jgi:hypothetical protein
LKTWNCTETDLSKPQNQKQTLTHTSFLKRRWTILSVIIGVAPDCAREGYIILILNFDPKFQKNLLLLVQPNNFYSNPVSDENE